MIGYGNGNVIRIGIGIGIGIENRNGLTDRPIVGPSPDPLGPFLVN